MMHVCIVLVGGDVDGPISGTGEIVRLNAKTVHEAGGYVTAALCPTSTMQAALEPYCSQFVPCAPATHRSSFGRNVWPIAKVIRKLRPDIIHFHVPNIKWGLDELIATNAARDVGVVRTEHNPIMQPLRWFDRPLVRLADRAVDAFIYVSVGNMRRFEALLPWRSRGRVVVNVIDFERFHEHGMEAGTSDADGWDSPKLPDGSRTAAFIAGTWNVDENDGRRPLAPVLRAMALLPDNWHLWVVGEGDNPRASAYANALGLGSRVHFLGRIGNAWKLTRASDVLVNASHFEGMSVSLLEAWYLGTPVVSTPVDGIEDVIGPKDISAVAAPHGDAHRFADLWRQSIEPASEFTRVSIQATSRVRQDFLPARWTAEILAVYEEVMLAR